MIRWVLTCESSNPLIRRMMMSSDELVKALAAMEQSWSKKLEEHAQSSQGGINQLTGAVRDMRDTQVATQARIGEFEKTLNRIGEKVDDTSERTAKVESGVEQLRGQNKEQYRMFNTLPKSVNKDGNFIDSPNLKWVVIPVILILVGLFGLAGYNVTKGTKEVISAVGGE